jgi:hypothetical protein
MMLPTRAARALSMAALLLSLGGCKGEVTPIRDLLANTGRYDGQTVAIAGEVKGAAGAFGYGVYQLDDGTGTITVVTEKGGVPAQGARIGVEGKFRSGITVGTESVAAIQETKRYAE